METNRSNGRDKTSVMFVSETIDSVLIAGNSSDLPTVNMIAWEFRLDRICSMISWAAGEKPQ